jgi:hypothetical protein
MAKKSEALKPITWELPSGFVVPAQPVKASKPLVGTDWVHEIKLTATELSSAALNLQELIGREAPR